MSSLTPQNLSCARKHIHVLLHQKAARETEIAPPAPAPQAQTSRAPTPSAPPAATAGGLDAETKKALFDIMAELEELRGLLKDDD